MPIDRNYLYKTELDFAIAIRNKLLRNKQNANLKAIQYSITIYKVILH